MPKTYEISDQNAGERLDKWLSEALDKKSRAAIKKLIESGHITVNGEGVKAGYTLKAGDTIEIVEPEAKTIDLSPKAIDYETVYEDDAILVINKPTGLVVHPSRTYTAPTLMHGVLDRIDPPETFEVPERAGIVHRLDKDTSGLLVIAKSQSVLTTLQEALKKRTVKRTYRAIIDGVIDHNKGTIDAPIARHPSKRKLMSVREGGRESVTHFKVLERFPHHTYVECHLETGRTHQIRVHFKYIGHPILGDTDYGRKKQDTEGFSQYLHAYALEFAHPVNGEPMRFTADLPEPFTAKLSAIRTSRD
ncbi:MAG: RluA family pseudouridine synthase [Bacillota bacterium]